MDVGASMAGGEASIASGISEDASCIRHAAGLATIHWKEFAIC